MIVFVVSKTHKISFDEQYYPDESQEGREGFRVGLKASYTNLWGEEVWVTFSDDTMEVVDEGNR